MNRDKKAEKTIRYMGRTNVKKNIITRENENKEWRIKVNHQINKICNRP